MPFENELFQFGMAGIFIAYLIYDRNQVVPKLVQALDKNTEVSSKSLEIIELATMREQTEHQRIFDELSRVRLPARRR